MTSTENRDIPINSTKTSAPSSQNSFSQSPLFPINLDLEKELFRFDYRQHIKELGIEEASSPDSSTTRDLESVASHRIEDLDSEEVYTHRHPAERYQRQPIPPRYGDRSDRLVRNDRGGREQGEKRDLIIAKENPSNKRIDEDDDEDNEDDDQSTEDEGTSRLNTEFKKLLDLHSQPVRLRTDGSMHTTPATSRSASLKSARIGRAVPPMRSARQGPSDQSHSGNELADATSDDSKTWYQRYERLQTKLNNSELGTKKLQFKIDSLETELSMWRNKYTQIEAKYRKADAQLKQMKRLATTTQSSLPPLPSAADKESPYTKSERSSPSDYQASAVIAREKDRLSDKQVQQYQDMERQIQGMFNERENALKMREEQLRMQQSMRDEQIHHLRHEFSQSLATIQSQFSQNQIHSPMSTSPPSFSLPMLTSGSSYGSISGTGSPNIGIGMPLSHSPSMSTLHSPIQMNRPMPVLDENAKRPHKFTFDNEGRTIALSETSSIHPESSRSISPMATMKSASTSDSVNYVQQYSAEKTAVYNEKRGKITQKLIPAGIIQMMDDTKYKKQNGKKEKELPTYGRGGAGRHNKTLADINEKKKMQKQRLQINQNVSVEQFITQLDDKPDDVTLMHDDLYYPSRQPVFTPFTAESLQQISTR